jgi:uncharacterized protein (DUF849 family)
LIVLKAAINGARRAGSHPALPLSVDELAADAAACVRAGAAAIHLHPRDASGQETLAQHEVDETVRAVRAAIRSASAGGVPVGVTTGAWIEADPERRAALVSTWHEPDMASVNLSEAGSEAVMHALLHAGIGIEAAVWSVDDVERLAASGATDRLVRVLVEILRPVDDPAAEARSIEKRLDDFGIAAPRLHHGTGQATWRVLQQAVQLGRDIRVGLEDTFRLPDGTDAPSNSALVTAALQLSRSG